MEKKSLSETRDFIRSRRKDDVHVLALQAGKYPQVDMQEAVIQIAGWQIAEKKIPSWASTEGIRYPQHLSMEQCSSEITARYKASLVEGDAFADLTGGFGVDCSFIARRFLHAHYVERQETLCKGDTFADLTGGFGVDCSFIARRFLHAHYVERQETLCGLASHNFALLGLGHIEVHHADGIAYLQQMAPVDCLYLDPARRDSQGGKTVAIAGCKRA